MDATILQSWLDSVGAAIKSEDVALMAMVQTARREPRANEPAKFKFDVF